MTGERIGDHAFPGAPEAPQAPAAPDCDIAAPAAPAELPAASPSTSGAAAYGRPAAAQGDPPPSATPWSGGLASPPGEDANALLRRAMGAGAFFEPDDDPTLWDDPSALSELRTLVGLGIVSGASAALVIPYALADGVHRLPWLFVLMFILGGVMGFSLIMLLILGFFATLRRQLFGWTIAGFVFTPLAYAVWAAVARRRIRAAVEEPGS